MTESPEEHEQLKDLLNLRLACVDFSEHAEAHIDLDYMLSWVTVDLQEDILKKLVLLSQCQNRRHDIRLLNISTAQLHGSIPVKDNSISVPDHAEELQLLGTAISGLTNCTALRLTGHPSAGLQRQSRFLPAAMPQYLNACTSDQHFQVVLNTSMQAFQLSGRNLPQLHLQEEGIFGHRNNENLVFDILASDMAGVPFENITILSYDMSPLPVRRPSHSTPQDVTRLLEYQFCNFVERLPCLNHLVLSVLADLGPYQDSNPYNTDFWSFSTIPLLSKLELQGGYPDNNDLAEFIRRHGDTITSVSFTNVAMIRRQEWREFAGLLVGLKLTEIIVDTPLQLSLVGFSGFYFGGYDTGIREVNRQGDVDAGLTKMQQDLLY